MNQEQMRARLAEISALIAGLTEKTDITEADFNQIEELNTEFASLSSKVEILAKAELAKTSANASAGRQVPPATPATPATSAAAAKKQHGFKSTGEFFQAVHNQSNRTATPGQIKAFEYEKLGEDGGYLVPEDMAAGIIAKLNDTTQSLFALTTQLKTSSNNMALNIDESQPWNRGIQAYWVDEGDTITESKPKFTKAKWELQKLACLVKPTDELLDDAVALESYIQGAAPEAIMYKLNSAIIAGDGVGKPIGFLNSPFAVTQAKESAQTADTIVASNVIKMYTRMLPPSRAKAVWLVTAEAESQLMTMKDDDGRFIYLAPGSQLNEQPYALLLGRPVIPMLYGMKALGDLGDIAFVDLSTYYTLIKASGGIKSEVSIHFNFDRDVTAFRFIMRVDGKVPFKAPVKAENGTYTMSSIVLLEAR